MYERVVNVWRHNIIAFRVNIHVGEQYEHGRPWFLFDGWQVTHGVFTLPYDLTLVGTHKYYQYYMRNHKTNV